MTMKKENFERAKEIEPTIAFLDKFLDHFLQDRNRNIQIGEYLKTYRSQNELRLTGPTGDRDFNKEKPSGEHLTETFRTLELIRDLSETMIVKAVENDLNKLKTEFEGL